MMEKYKFFDKITSDVLFEAYGKDLAEVFVNAAEAMFSVMCKIEQVEAKEGHTVEVRSDSTEGLMVEWLQTLIAEVDIQEMFFSRFEIIEIDETHLKATIHGESISAEKGETVVKAVTYHQYEFKKTEYGYMCRVSLDI
ncbi:MAG: archease [Candidatus Woesearchaeota archaeon]